ncbi:MAG: M1 family metallopeptidase [Flavisolibacter sp.]
MYKFLPLLLFVSINRALAQSPIDIVHYKFELSLTNTSDSIKGKATIDFKWLASAANMSLDLVQMHDNTGMTVSSVTGDNVTSFSQSGDKIIINVKKAIPGKIASVTIFYSGIPSDGLIISKNKYGDRTFFADNWPNRAHYWIPCKDSPADKATFEFIVTAPFGYQVISNGVLKEKALSSDGMQYTHWQENVSLSTKVMVIGVAKFAVKTFSDSPENIPVSAWVYPQDSTNGFYDYGVTPSIVKFFSSYIAPFPYEKLANVQSKTIFGGMENASAIFYAEQSVTGNRKWEDVFAHEIVHQWFGDMASEKAFSHLWLSEGFATYLTDIYMGNKFGKDSGVNRLKKEREDIIEFVKKNNHPVVDSTSNLMNLLNVNSYQKGGWVLHMIHAEVGDKLFQNIIQEYYNQYKGSNADTRDFEHVVEKVTGKDWKAFFDQWLYRPGIPELQVAYQFKKASIEIKIQQKTKEPYTYLPLECSIKLQDGSSVNKTLFIHQQTQSFTIPLSSNPKSFTLDPHTTLLFRQ